MANLGRFLPLSMRDPEDESGVTGDWSALIADCLDRVAAMLEALDDPRWDDPAGPDGRRIRALVEDLVDRCTAARNPSIGGILGRSLSNDAIGLPAVEHLARQGAPGTVVLREQLSRAADGLRSAPQRRHVLRPRVGLLTRVVVSGYDISRAAGVPVVFPPLATGAVALARATAAPTPIRAVIRGRTLVATDDGWRFGTGPELSGTALEHILFLFDRSDRIPGA